MKNKIRISLFVAASLLAGSSLAQAGAGWETSLLVSSGTAESRLAFGQRADATSRADGRYDVPAMLGGTLQAAFTGGSGPLWRDIRTFGRNLEEWHLAIVATGGRPVQITWDGAGLPKGFRFELIDADTDQVIAMEAYSAYTVAEPAAVLTVRVSAK